MIEHKDKLFLSKAVDRRSPLPLHFQLKEILKTCILNEFKTGEKLPSERSLAKHYDVSRVSITKVIGELVLEGLVERLRGKGTFVRNNRLSEITQDRRKIIGLLIATVPQDQFHPFFTERLRAIFETCNLRKYDVQALSIDFEEARGREDYFCHNELIDRGIKGLLVDTLDNLILGDALLARKIPFVSSMSYAHIKDYPFVCIDGFKCSYLGTTFLANLGHKKIGFIYTGETGKNFLDMYNIPKPQIEGYKAALRDKNINFDPSTVIKVNYSTNIKEQIEQILKRRKFSAIYINDDTVAFRVINLMIDWKIVNDIAIVSFVNKKTEFPSMITRVEIDAYAVGKLATEMLLDLIEGKVVPNLHVFLEPELIQSKSK